MILLIAVAQRLQAADARGEELMRKARPVDG
jgi:hypothetical protein